MPANRILLWRHGRTEWNQTKRIQGQSDIELDDVGLRQATQAAGVLALEKPDYIVASDLRRTVRTAEPLAATLGLTAHLDPRLRERSFGPWEGLTGAEVAAAYPAAYAAWRAGGEPAIPGIESNAEFRTRVLAGIAEGAEAATDTLCVVTHGGAAYRAVVGLLELPADLVWRLEPVGNCRWIDLRHTNRGWRLHGYNLGPIAGIAGPDVDTPVADVEPVSANQ